MVHSARLKNIAKNGLSGCFLSMPCSDLLQRAMFGSVSSGIAVAYLASMSSAFLLAFATVAGSLLWSTVCSRSSSPGSFVRVQFWPTLPFAAVGMFSEQKMAQLPGSICVATCAYRPTW